MMPDPPPSAYIMLYMCWVFVDFDLEILRYLEIGQLLPAIQPYPAFACTSRRMMPPSTTACRPAYILHVTYVGLDLEILRSVSFFLQSNHSLPSPQDEWCQTYLAVLHNALAFPRLFPRVLRGKEKERERAREEERERVKEHRNEK